MKNLNLINKNMECEIIIKNKFDLDLKKEWEDLQKDANINFFQALKNDVQRQENYFGLIRMNLGKIDYHLLETNKKHLSEINTVDDLKNCKFSLKG